MIHGQIEEWEAWPDGFVSFNRRTMYAALNWGTEMYLELVDILRQLSGGGVFQMPASVSVLHDPAPASYSQPIGRRRNCRRSIG